MHSKVGYPGDAVISFYNFLQFGKAKLTEVSFISMSCLIRELEKVLQIAKERECHGSIVARTLEQWGYRAWYVAEVIIK